MDEQVASYVSIVLCVNALRDTTVVLWIWLQRKWERMHVGYCHEEQVSMMTTVDSHCKWPEVR